MAALASLCSDNGFVTVTKLPLYLGRLPLWLRYILHMMERCTIWHWERHQRSPHTHRFCFPGGVLAVALQGSKGWGNGPAATSASSSCTRWAQPLEMHWGAGVSSCHAGGLQSPHLRAHCRVTRDRRDQRMLGACTAEHVQPGPL